MTEPNIAQKNPFVQATDPGSYWWCACGLSQTQPFCDGSHKETDIKPVQVKIAENKTIAWCGCKHTGNKPFCDGTHSSL